MEEQITLSEATNITEALVEKRLEKGNRITMSNALTRAGHGLTLSEKRILFMALSMLNKNTQENNDLKFTKIKADEYAALFGLDINTAYDQLQTATKHLFERKITFYEPSHKRKNKSLSQTKVQMRWVGTVKYHRGEGWVELHWWPMLLQQLTGLKNHFTTYQLSQACGLRSVYSWRLLELLTRFRSSGWAEYTVEDFAQSMDATEKQKANFNNIKRRMIEPAIKELTLKDGWSIKWIPLKEGRKVKAIKFEFSRKASTKKQCSL